MKLTTTLVLIILIAASVVFSITCAKSKSPLEPSINESDRNTIDIPASFDDSNKYRNVIAVYECSIDSAAETFTIESAQRNSNYHYPLTQIHPGVLQITDYGFTPNFWADIKLTHPYPGSGIDGFDPRIIAILPANPGNSMYYPIFNVYANDAIVKYPDGYTKLFDELGGSIPGNTNPYKAYFKDQPNRIWSSTGVTTETQRWEMDISGFGGTFAFTLVVDVSTNYPDSPQSVIDNIQEPAQMHIEIEDVLMIGGGGGIATATFLDWQGPSEIKCKVEIPDLLEQALQLTYKEPSSNPDEYIFTGTVTNDLGAAPGDHDALLAAWDINIGNHVFIETSVTISDLDPENVTPPGLNFCPGDIIIKDEYVYIESEKNGFQIFSINDPVNPVWINSIEFSNGNVINFDICDNYAFTLVNTISGPEITVIDISQPETAYIEQRIPTSLYFRDIYVLNGYAYLGGDSTYFGALEIIDIEPLDSAHSVISLDTSDTIRGLTVANGYAYLAEMETGLEIVDVDPPETASVINTIDTSGYALEVMIQGDYAYVADFLSGVQIIDINLPETAYIVNNVDTNAAQDVFVEGDYAYVPDGRYGMKIIDINAPESAQVVKTIYTPGDARDVFSKGNYAYITDESTGLLVVDINPPESATIVSILNTPGTAFDVVIKNHYAYIANREGGLQVLDISLPESPAIVKTVDTNNALGVKVDNEYAYIADGTNGLVIVDINPLDTAHIINTLDTDGSVMDVAIEDRYAYLADNYNGLTIVNIDPPDTAFIENTVSLTSIPWRVDISDGFAYVANYELGLKIIDIDPVDTAYLVTTVTTPGKANHVTVSSGYAYVGCGEDGMQIIDIDPPETAYIEKTVQISFPYGTYITDGYAYVANASYGLSILDIDPIDSAQKLVSVNTPDLASNLDANDDYVFVADWYGGLQIIRLR